MKKPIILLTVASALVVGIALLFMSRQPKKGTPVETPEQVFCTQDAMMCPDGSYVGRVGPKCEFKACPQ